MRTRTWLTFGSGALALLMTTSLSAQPVQRDHRVGHTATDFRNHKDLGRHQPPAAGPRTPPPAPRAERAAARAGFVWIPGHYNWNGTAYAWLPGHYERARAGKHWVPGRWENRGGTYSWVAGSWAAGAETPPPPPGAPPPPPGTAPVAGPTAAPPPPRNEAWKARAGFVWIPGHWDWKNNKWSWLPGHEERARAGKAWRPARWEQQNGRYVLVNGDWVDASSVPPPGAMPPPGAQHHREWKLDRPVVSDYWPVKGKAGTRVVIHGRNFPPDLGLVWGGKPIQAEHITATKVTFRVPKDATSGMLVMRQSHGPAITIGMFQVANYDAAAEQAKREAAWKKQAQAEWAARQKQLAKDRAGRLANFQKRWKEQEQTREQRRAQREAEIRAKWDAAFLSDANTQAELTLHAQRVAQLARMKDLAEIDANGSLAVRIDTDTERENARHEERMQALKAAFAANGGHP